MDVVEGNVLSFHLCSLADVILKKDSLTSSIITDMIRYVETVPLDKLKRMITREFLIEVKKVKEEKKENVEIVNSLLSLLSFIAFWGAIHVGVVSVN
jgi:hypothetical protein